VDKSLVQCDWGHGTSRYRLLEPIRQYAGEKLRRHGENDSAARAHMLALLALVESFPEVELHFRSALGNASRVL
jgi:predicted ATPase